MRGIGYVNLGLDAGTSGRGERLGYGIEAGGKDFAMGLYSTHFSGEHHQRVGGASVRVGEVTARYENDGTPFGKFLGDGEDRYRTNAVQISWRDYSLGINLYTGNSATANKERINGDGRMKNGYYTGGNVDDYRLGALYIGYKDYQVGVNSEHVRHVFQNKLAHDFIKPQSGFLRLSCDWHPYYNYAPRYRYTLW